MNSLCHLWTLLVGGGDGEIPRKKVKKLVTKPGQECRGTMGWQTEKEKTTCKTRGQGSHIEEGLLEGGGRKNTQSPSNETGKGRLQRYESISPYEKLGVGGSGRKKRQLIT